MEDFKEGRCLLAFWTAMKDNAVWTLSQVLCLCLNVKFQADADLVLFCGGCPGGSLRHMRPFPELQRKEVIAVRQCYFVFASIISGTYAGLRLRGLLHARQHKYPIACALG